MDSPASLGAIIRDRRLALGYSLGQLATKVNKTAASIRSWEKDDTEPSEAEANALATALDLETGLLVDLLGESEVWEEEPALDVAVADPWDGDDEGAAEAQAATDDAAPIDEQPETAEPEQVPQEEEAEDTDPDSAADMEAAVGEKVDDEFDDSESAKIIPAVVVPDSDVADDLDDVAGGPIDDVIDGQEALDAAKASLADEAASRPAPTTDSTIHEAMTEAVPVVPAAVAVAAPDAAADPSRGDAATDPFGVTRNSNPLIYWWDTAADWYRRVFDPRNKWVYRVRAVFVLLAFYVMLRLLVWAGSELWDAIGEVLDSISFSPSETPDVTN